MTDNLSKISTERSGLKAGAITLGALLVYFMIMKSFHFMDSVIAWSFNFVLLAAGIVLAFLYYRLKSTLNVEYIPGLILGTVTTATAVFPFAIFVYYYFSKIDPSLLLLLKDNVLFMSEDITPASAAFATAIEGICSGVLVTFIVMQYFRTGFRRKKDEKLMHG